MLRALTRAVSPAIGSCELTHLSRQPLDHARAVRQHAAYEEALTGAGCTLERVEEAPGLADSVFVEDTAVVLDDLAVLTRPGAASRRAEVDAVGEVLGRWRPLVRIAAPGTLDGGDVLRVGNRLFVGTSARTNAEGISQLAAFCAPSGVEVVAVPLRDALHLKTAVTALDDETLLAQPRWVDAAHFPGLRIVEVDPGEPFAANTLRVGPRLIVPAAHPRTAERCAPFVDEVVLVEADELAKAEGGVTCCSIILETAP
jgi:dimethylargininase